MKWLDFHSDEEFLQVIALIQSVIILIAAHYGFGTSIELLKSDAVVRIQNVCLLSPTHLILWRKTARTKN